jgi:pentatricopeptide repeat protein
MQIEGVAPDATTLLCLITACVHSGLLDEAYACFRNMDRDYGIVPNPEIYSCLAVGLGYAGHLDEAMLMTMEKASSTTASSCSRLDWLVLLGCCRKWGNLGLGRSAFNLAIRPTIERQTSGQEDGD